MRANPAYIALLVSTMLCACSEIPKDYPEHTMRVAAGDHRAVTYDAIELASDNILGRDSPYPTHMVGPLLAVTSNRGTKYCGKGIPRGSLVQIPMCFSVRELQEMHVDTYNVVKVARAEPQHVVRLANAELTRFER